MRRRWMAVLGLAALPAALLFSPAFGQDVPEPPELPAPEQHCGSITVDLDGESQAFGGCIPPDDGGGGEASFQLCGEAEVTVNGETHAVGGCIPPEDGGTFPPELPEPPDGLPEPPDGLPEPPDGLPEPPDGLPEPPDGLPEPPDGLPELPGVPGLPV